MESVEAVEIPFIFVDSAPIIDSRIRGVNARISNYQRPSNMP